MTDTHDVVKTPSEQLAEKILAALVDKQLLLAEDVGKMADKLANGKLRDEDWRITIEKAMDKGAAK